MKPPFCPAESVPYALGSLRNVPVAFLENASKAEETMRRARKIKAEAEKMERAARMSLVNLWLIFCRSGLAERHDLERAAVRRPPDEAR